KPAPASAGTQVGAATKPAIATGTAPDPSHTVPVRSPQPKTAARADAGAVKTGAPVAAKPAPKTVEPQSVAVPTGKPVDAQPVPAPPKSDPNPQPPTQDNPQ